MEGFVKKEIVSIIASFLLLNASIMAHSNHPKVIGGYLDDLNLVTIQFGTEIDDISVLKKIKVIDSDGRDLGLLKLKKSEDPFFINAITKKQVNIKKGYYVHFNHHKKRLVLNKIYRHEQFYDLEAKLGATYSKKATQFALFAPRATEVKVNIYDNPIRTKGETVCTYQMKEQKGGVWKLNVDGDLNNKYYTYQIKSVGEYCHPDLEIVDPYAKVVTRGDGISVIYQNENQPFNQTLGRSLIFNASQIQEVAELRSPYNKIEDAIIYEFHVRDLTRDHNSGVPDSLKGMYLGVAYGGAKYKKLSTGIDHIAELGVTVVQIQPVMEFVVGNERDYKHKYIRYEDGFGYWPEERYYDWGYGPINYFSVEGWYATSLDDDSRIREFKKMISEFHRRGIRVTLDVVLNHTFEGARDNPNSFLFRGIDMDYYYRSKSDGTLYDGIFCGNELHTENPMVRKYILDCLKYWVTEFKIDGFRFDWMSAMDPTTLSMVVRELRAINPNILLYGELWTLRDLSYTGKDNGTYVDRQHVALFERDYNLPPGSIAGFNDYFRDAVKGSGFQRDYSGGYIQNTINELYYPHSENGHKPYELVRKAITGMIDYVPKGDDPTEWQHIRSPLNSLNYIACHDGFTLWDKLIIAEYCQYMPPGAKNSPKTIYPQSKFNPNIVDFNDLTQFADKNVEQKLKKMDKLGAAILLTSQGIPFIHAGQEFLRQKIDFRKLEADEPGTYVFDSNSNTSSDAVNAIKWALKEKNFHIFKYYQGLIKLRKGHPTFRRTTQESILKGFKFEDEWLPENSERCIAYNLIDPDDELKGETWKDVAVLINPHPEPKAFTIPKKKWHIVVDGENADVKTLKIISGGKIKVVGISIMVLHADILH